MGNDKLYGTASPVSLLATKTFWGGIASITSGVTGYLSGTIDIGETIGLIMMGLQSIFLRAAVSKGL